MRYQPGANMALVCPGRGRSSGMGLSQGWGLGPALPRTCHHAHLPSLTPSPCQLSPRTGRPAPPQYTSPPPRTLHLSDTFPKFTIPVRPREGRGD